MNTDQSDTQRRQALSGSLSVIMHNEELWSSLWIMIGSKRMLIANKLSKLRDWPRGTVTLWNSK
jgi:hypothetical protein